MRERSPRIYLDLTDVQTHALWHASCSGIQRVQLEIAMTLLKAGEDIVPFSLFDGTWRSLRTCLEHANGDSDAMLRQLQKAVPFPGVYPSLRRPVETIRLIGSRLATRFKRYFCGPPRLCSEDVVFVGGAFWSSPHVIQLCKHATEVGASLIVLVHDLIPLIHPEFTGHDYSNEFQEILKLPAHFIVTTDHNRNTLESVRSESGYGESSVTVVSLAHQFPCAERDASAGETPPRLQGLKTLDFALCVGTVEIRKNHSMLFSVWDELAAELGDRLPPLVVAGRRGWKADAALQRLDEFFDSGRLIFIEAPSDEELRWLYSTCSFTVFPSLYEGWGLPVGESLWFGKPCAASDASSIPYVAAGLCALFSPVHATTIKEAIYSLLDPNTRRAHQERIRKASLRTWSDVAFDVAKILASQRQTFKHLASDKRIPPAPPSEEILSRDSQVSQIPIAEKGLYLHAWDVSHRPVSK
jgi:glycosyltransferase involved in cell wall biosynthesis